ncbi:hypothetical protein [Mannheimia sp. E16BA]|uniref:hypothetical protein n=2 Tax=unclassified Mannheimia TaxID=2645054 RepID=UPI00359DD314
MIEFYSYWVLINQECDDKYTYDTYNRTATREFDADFSEGKDGAERIENYTYDNYGRLIETKEDILGDAIDVNSRMVRERDEFGRDKVIRNYQADGTLIWKREYEYDEYGYITKFTNYSSETNKSFINSYTRDEFGRVFTLWEDKNANEIFDVGDLKQTLIYNQSINSNYAERIDESVSSKTHNFYTYDELNRRVTSFRDKNGNKQVDGNEVFTKYSYIGETGITDVMENYRGGDKLEQLYEVRKIIYQDAGISGSHIAALNENVTKAETTLYYGVSSLHYSTKDDYTSEKWRALLDNYENKIIQINLTNARASTDITVDNDVIAKISKNPTLRINGDGTDTVRLKDSSEFTKLEAKVNAGSNEFHQYTTTVEGESYTLQIDTDINVVLA